MLEPPDWPVYALSTTSVAPNRSARSMAAATAMAAVSEPSVPTATVEIMTVEYPGWRPAHQGAASSRTTSSTRSTSARVVRKFVMQARKAKRPSMVAFDR